jgi:hypothetical protein
MMMSLFVALMQRIWSVIPHPNREDELRAEEEE